MSTTDETAGIAEAAVVAVDPYPSGSLRTVFSRQEIQGRVRTLGRDVAGYYRERIPEGSPGLVVLGVLKGAFVFLADLVRAVDLPLQVGFLSAASYGSGTTSSGRVRMRHEPELPLEGRHVLLVEDIVDSGTTLEHVVPMLKERAPATVEVCTLLHKERDEAAEVRPRWIGFPAPDEFLVGYGLDYDESFRHLPHIATFEQGVDESGAERAPAPMPRDRQ